MNTRSSMSSVKEIQDAIKAEFINHDKQFMDTFSKRLDKLEALITEKDNIILKQEKRIDELECKLDQVVIDNDSLEQYGRRMNFRVENVEKREGETDGSLQNNILHILRKSGVQIQPDDVVRHHRSSKIREKEIEVEGGKKTIKYGQCIVKVSSWRVREAVHKARKKSRDNGHPVRQDLTQRRYELIAKARGIIEGWGELPQPVFAYANINCEPSIRRGADVFKFKSERELMNNLPRFAPE